MYLNLLLSALKSNMADISKEKKRGGNYFVFSPDVFILVITKLMYDEMNGLSNGHNRFSTCSSPTFK